LGRWTALLVLVLTGTVIQELVTALAVLAVRAADQDTVFTQAVVRGLVTVITDPFCVQAGFTVIL